MEAVHPKQQNKLLLPIVIFCLVLLVITLHFDRKTALDQRGYVIWKFSSQNGTVHNKSFFKSIKAGSTTVSEIKNKLGKPNRLFKDENIELLIYGYGAEGTCKGFLRIFTWCKIGNTLFITFEIDRKTNLLKNDSYKGSSYYKKIMR